MSAATMPTLLDMVKQRGNDAVVGLIEEVITSVPEFGLLPSRGIPGVTYRTLARVGLPTVGFRNANEGSVESKSAYEQRDVATFIMNPSWKCDKAVADIHPDGPEAYIAMEGSGMTTAAAMTICSQMYYGGDAKGFQGLSNFVDSSLVIDATGSTPNGGSSVWAIKFGIQDVSLVFGANGNLDLSDVRIGDAYDANERRYTAYLQELLSWVGLSVLSKWSVGRIKNLTIQSGKGLTDNLLSQLLECFPTGHEPDAFIMTRRSRGQLQRSRTATNATGAEAPRPTEYEGIPIITSESLVNTEAIV